MAENAIRPGLRKLPAWLPIPLLLAAIIGLWVADLHTSYESPNLMLGLNFVFSVLVSLFIASLVGRSFLVRGTPGLMLLGCGVMVWGAAGFVAGTAGLVATGGRNFANITVTIHNSCVWLAGLCYLTGVVLSLRPSSAMRATGLWLAAAYSLAVVAVGAVTLAAVEAWTPPFFVQGEGGTLVRQLVLGSAIAMFLITALLLMAGYRRSASSFTYWYSLALMLIVTGLFGVMVQSSAGSLLGWTGRAAQFLSGVYMLVAAVASVRESRAWELPLEEALQRERSFVAAVLKTVGALVVVLDRQGRIVSFNRACEETTGYSFAEVKGRCFWDFLLAAEETEQVKAIFAQLRAGQFPNEHENYWVAKDGNRRLIHWTNECLTDSSGAVEYVIGTGIDVTQRKRAEEALAEQAGLLDLSNDAILVRDASDRISYWNRGATEAYGYRTEEAVGKSPHELLKTVFPEPLDRITEKLRRDGRWTGELIHTRKDGSQITTISRWVLDRDTPGKPGSILETNTDITERKRAERELEEMRVMLSEGERIAHLGSWRWNADTGETVWSEEEFRIYGLEPGSRSPSYEELMSKHFHPEDAATLGRVFREAIGTGSIFENDHRVVRPDGNIRFIHNRAVPQFDASGKLVAYLGATLDITESQTSRRDAEGVVA